MDQFARPIWETDEDRLTARVKHLENEIQLGKELMTASRLMVDAALNDMEVKDAEIAQLKAELELTKKQRDQAIQFAKIERVKRRSIGTSHYYEEGIDTDFPELYAHLAGRGE